MRHNEHRTMDDDPATGPDPRVAQRARDTRWVADALAGDQRAFGRLYDAWFDRVYNLALGVARDPETAADITQDTFLAAWKNLGTLEDPDAFGGWLLRIARNTSFNRSKKEGRSRPVDDEAMAVIEATGATPGNAPAGFGAEQQLAALADPARLAGDGELVALVHEAAAALGPRDAEVLDLQLRYGLTPAEIGEVIGMNRNAANQLCHRIRGRFASSFLRFSNQGKTSSSRKPRRPSASAVRGVSPSSSSSGPRASMSSHHCRVSSRSAAKAAA